MPRSAVHQLGHIVRMIKPGICLAILGIVLLSSQTPLVRADSVTSGLTAPSTALPHIGREITEALEAYGDAASVIVDTTDRTARRAEIDVKPAPRVVEDNPKQEPNGAQSQRTRLAPNGEVRRLIQELKRDYRQLAAYHDQLQTKFERLLRSNRDLLQKHEQLQRNVGELLRYNRELQANVAELRRTREQLQGNFERLQRVHSALRNHGSDVVSVARPAYRASDYPVFRGAGADGEPVNNGTVSRHPASFPPDFTN